MVGITAEISKWSDIVTGTDVTEIENEVEMSKRTGREVPLRNWGLLRQ